MMYEEMVKEAFRFKRMGISGKIRRLVGFAPKAIPRRQSPEGRIFDKMMAEFVAVNPKAVRQAYAGQASPVARRFQKFQKKFLKRSNIDPRTLEARLPRNEAVLSAQVKRHHRRQVKDPGLVPGVPERKRPGVAAPAMAGTAVGLTIAHQASEKK